MSGGREAKGGKWSEKQLDNTEDKEGINAPPPPTPLPPPPNGFSQSSIGAKSISIVFWEAVIGSGRVLER